MGGASGGYTTGPKELIDLLRQRGRPYLFSNSLPPPVIATGIKVSIAFHSVTLTLFYVDHYSSHRLNLFNSAIFHPFKYNLSKLICTYATNILHVFVCYGTYKKKTMSEHFVLMYLAE
jgi:hypothetical protein